MHSINKHMVNGHPNICIQWAETLLISETALNVSNKPYEKLALGRIHTLQNTIILLEYWHSASVA